MSENVQMTEQVFSNIDAIGATMEGTVDLKDDVAPFMFSTFAKIKQLAMVKSDNPEAQYELFQIATNYLPRTVNAYCAFPIDYRNTRVIKAEKTARQLLIEDLKIFKQQVFEIEKQFYEGLESQIKVNSSVVREKYDTKFQLATELEQVGEDGFVNQFDYSNFQNSNDYKNITFKKKIDEQEIIAKQKAEKRAKNLDNAMKTVMATGSMVGSFLYSKPIALYNKFKKPIDSFLNKALRTVIYLFTGDRLAIGGIIAVLSCGAWVLISMDDSFRNPNSLYVATSTTSRNIHEFMGITVIPQSEFKTYVKTKEDELLNTSYRKKRIVIVSDEKTKDIVMNISDINKERCMLLIDNKEKLFDSATMKVNGIDLPQDNVISDSTMFLTENHKFCHLEEGNRLSIDFNNQKIYDIAKHTKPLTSKEKEIKLASMQAEADSYAKKMENYGMSSERYKFAQASKDKIQDIMEALKKEKTVDAVTKAASN